MLSIVDVVTSILLEHDNDVGVVVVVAAVMTMDRRRRSSTR